MDNYLNSFCERIQAEEVDCIAPFFTIITNPMGDVVLDPTFSNHLSFVFVCFRGHATVRGESLCSYLEESQYLSFPWTCSFSQICFSDDYRGYICVMAKSFCDSFLVKDKYAIQKYYQVPVTLDLDEVLRTQYFHGFELLKCAVRRHPPHAEDCFTKLFRILFVFFSDHERSGKETTSCRNEQIAERFLSLIEDDDRVKLDEDSLSGMNRLTGGSWSLIPAQCRRRPGRDGGRGRRVPECSGRRRAA